ncbi:MBL fold metallo-hydrolase [Steroidobacter sp. S1-65]|uniref:MBL fold metallo-hydrolase n=1 Tax=Steroidobacter gossypii TaxID=2805490 RepID=A0ABS1WWW6_9GAMM|nr:MBL fold metallo-hydrolase [Steroidobacter gossypii]MBM0105469.1 MBL fold metallo-hydrolase [Steroidobacter gossypii]
MRRASTLARVVCSAGAMLLTSAAFSAEPPHSADISKRNLTPQDFPRWQRIAPDVYAYEGLHSPDKQGVIVNTVSLIVATGDGVVVVDGQGDVPQTRLMIENIRKLTPEPIKYVVIASDHTDHVGGNSAFKEAYPNVVFIGSPASQKRLAKDPNPPTMLVSEQRSLRLGAIQIEILNLGRAHTGGDLVAWLPESNVLFLGEVFLRDVFPAMRSAYPTEWLATLRKAATMNASYYIPGHGFIDEAPIMRRELDEARLALASVIDEAERLHAAGHKCESAANCPALEHANWGEYHDWALRSSQAPIAVWRVYQELEGKLPES